MWTKLFNTATIIVSAALIFSCNSIISTESQENADTSFNSEEQEALKQAAMDVCLSVVEDETQCEEPAAKFATCEEETCTEDLKMAVKSLLIEIYGEADGERIFDENLDILDERLQTAEIKMTLTKEPVVLKADTVAGKIVLSWSPYTGPDFKGYKVVVSDTNKTPKYPDDQYVAYIPSSEDTTLEVSPEFLTSHFGITILTEKEKYYSNWITVEVDSVPEKKWIDDCDKEQKTETKEDDCNKEEVVKEEDVVKEEPVVEEVKKEEPVKEEVIKEEYLK